MGTSDAGIALKLRPAVSLMHLLPVYVTLP